MQDQTLKLDINFSIMLKLSTSHVESGRVLTLTPIFFSLSICLALGFISGLSKMHYNVPCLMCILSYFVSFFSFKTHWYFITHFGRCSIVLYTTIEEVRIIILKFQVPKQALASFRYGNVLALLNQALLDVKYTVA